MNILVCNPSMILDEPDVVQNIIYLCEKKSDFKKEIDYNIFDISRAAAVIEKRTDAKLFVKDMQEFSYWRITQYIDFNKIDLIILEGSSQQQSTYFKQIFKFIQVIKSFKPSIKVLLSGRDFTFLYRFIFKHFPFVDYIIIGEMEKTLSELVRALIKHKDKSDKIKNIHGLAFLDKGKLIITPERKLIENLDELPYPAYHHFNISKDTTLLISTSRG